LCILFSQFCLNFHFGSTSGSLIPPFLPFLFFSPHVCPVKTQMNYRRFCPTPGRTACVAQNPDPTNPLFAFPLGPPTQGQKCVIYTCDFQSFFFVAPVPACNSMYRRPSRNFSLSPAFWLIPIRNAKIWVFPVIIPVGLVPSPDNPPTLGPTNSLSMKKLLLTSPGCCPVFLYTCGYFSLHWSFSFYVSTAVPPLCSFSPWVSPESAPGKTSHFIRTWVSLKPPQNPSIWFEVFASSSFLVSSFPPFPSLPAASDAIVRCDDNCF